MGSRRQARESTLQMLYLCDNCRFTPDEAHLSFEALGIEKNSFVEKLFFGTWEEKLKLDKLISDCAENWEMDRMAVVDRNILRLATFEIVNMPETPISVIIDEAVEIAKKYSTIDSGKFVNGILDKLKSARSQEPQAHHTKH